MASPPAGHVPPVVRPHYPRITAAVSSVVVTLVAVLGATGILPTGAGPESAYAAGAPAESKGMVGSMALSGTVGPMLLRDHRDHRGLSVSPVDPTVVPEDSGEGRRVVFDMDAQRVWLVTAKERVRRTYLVSGSVTDNLDAGSYEVYSTSMEATGIDDSGTMRYMVRFASGERAAIGFHDIPVKDGERVQTRADLGTPQSHGCIRQWRPDARALWDFAPVGTAVVVV